MSTQTEQQRFAQAILDARSRSEKERAIDRYESYMRDVRSQQGSPFVADIDTESPFLADR